MSTGTKTQKIAKAKKTASIAVLKPAAHKIANQLLQIRLEDIVDDLAEMDKSLNTEETIKILQLVKKQEALRKELRQLVEQPNTVPELPITIRTSKNVCILGGREIKRKVKNLKSIHTEVGDRFYDAVTLTIEKCEDLLKSNAPLYISSFYEGTRKIVIEPLSVVENKKED